ncbi:hypothetical protein CHS0354_042832 [Potamilus streckersoni]|uniref:Uncharacterized protein n=1 Tax=Potamilus streckersoni TaxID=2493646 RepID=A0AAE0W806_9BIVA|nr:hypothetical protein CHS0354_042832 [Potamilus streckersoni]
MYQWWILSLLKPSILTLKIGNLAQTCYEKPPVLRDFLLAEGVISQNMFYCIVKTMCPEAYENAQDTDKNIAQITQTFNFAIYFNKKYELFFFESVPMKFLKSKVFSSFFISFISAAYTQIQSNSNHSDI